MRAGGALLFGLLAALALRAGEPAPVAAGPLPDERAALRRGVAALPEILRQIDAVDPDVSLRARRLARRIALDHYRSTGPKGMRLIPGDLEFRRASVRCVDGLYLSVHEVTLGEFREFARRQGWDLTRWKEGAVSLPVTRVSLREARAYAAARGMRLPTESELIRAGHGGGAFRYPWGDRFEPMRANSREAGRGAPEAVGSRKGAVSIHGVADLLGNVAEWTETSAGRGARKRFAVVGGSFRVPARPGVTRTYRLAETARLPDVGFRLAKALPPIPAPPAGKES